MRLDDNTFLQSADTIKNSYMDQTGKKIGGYYCTYIPEELIHAAGLFPYRIRATGNEDTDLADTYMVRFTCSFIRSTLNMALQGGFDFLDGLFICNSCDHGRRMYELYDLVVFEREGLTKTIPRFYISLPHILSKESFGWVYGEILDLKEKMEKIYDVNITNDKLSEAIRLYNRNRELMREIFKLRLLHKPKLTGTEALRISIANSSVPKHIANPELEGILQFLMKRKGINTSSKKRILLLGSVVDNVQFTELIEDSGAIIVSDNLCFGNRTIVDDIKEINQNNPLEQITERLYYHLSCPRMMDDHPRRLEFVKTEIEKGNVDGVILQRINNCDLHGCDNMLFEHELKDLDIPVYNFDRENFQSDNTRLKTRIQAFIEMIP